MKIVIGGSTRAGKTTMARQLANTYDMPVYHADDLVSLGWSEASDAFADVIAHGRDGIYEGVASIRSLRKLLRRPTGRVPPCTSYVHLVHPVIPWVHVTPGQRAMNAAIASVWRDMAPRLRARGVSVWCPAEPAVRF